MRINHLDVPDWDSEQLRIILDDPSSWQLVLAGPGAGKSAVACQRIAHLVDEGVEPSRIMLVSFTRTAVAELRDRIVSYAVAGVRARAVRISTIDSQAWRLRSGFEFDPLVDIKGESSYDLSISGTVELFKNRDPGLLDHMDRIEHLIIDEAQDVVGIRADLIVEILRSLSGECGVTILADPAQAIYGFTSDDEQDCGEGGTLLQQLATESPRPFEQRQLTNNHRVQNQELLDVFSCTRHKVDRPGDVDGHVESVVSAIRDTALENLGQASHDKIAQHISRRKNGSMLVLFRRRADVLLASSFCSGKGVQHRLRLSGLTTAVRPWIGWMFSEFDKPLIAKREFEALWQQRKDLCSVPFEGEDSEEAWMLLRQLAASRRGGSVDIVYLRTLASRSRPPVEICIPDLGTKGPILGTIHASKGREEDTVALVLPVGKSERQFDSVDAELEEGRVYYVGATRARESLVTAGHGGSPASQLDSGRVYRRIYRKGKKLPRMQLEIGREGDADRHTHLAWSTAGDIQRILARAAHGTLSLKAVLRPNIGFKYRLVLGGANTEDLEIAQLSDSFDQDIRKLWSQVDIESRLRPGNYLPHIYMVGATTVALSDSEMMGVRPPFSRSGFALAPVVKGLTIVQFIASGRRNRRNL